MDDMLHHAEVEERTRELYRSVKETLRTLEMSIPDLYSAQGLYEVFRKGVFAVPYLWEGREEMKAAIAWRTALVNGGVQVVDDQGMVLPAGERMKRIFLRSTDLNNRMNTNQIAQAMRALEEGLRDSYEVPNTVLRDVPQPLVSVRTTTYQHAAYIKECIDAVLAQKTPFPFEYLIGEDFSTDGTREIVMRCAQENPGLIRLVTADRNVGFRANGRRTVIRSRGKYMAICEGDDLWIDPHKLAGPGSHPRSRHDLERMRERCLERDRRCPAFQP
ncbi:MAG: glycosyltransferase [Flavobacteriales bacterium]|nr:glycosyltransferase [Flavobacteriales bacterium]